MRILFVEDELEIAEAFIENLRERGDAVDALKNGDMALQVILEYHSEYDLVILDSTLPKLGAGAVCKSVRESGIDIPILMLVTQQDMETRRDIFECGASDYLVKPFTPDEFLLRVTALMERQNVFAPVILTAGSMTLNVLERTIEHGEKKVELTQKEVDVLQYLMRNQGRVVSRHELWQELWGDDSGPKSNIVNAHVKNVRKKLRTVERDAETVRIETIRGVGFRLLEI